MNSVTNGVYYSSQMPALRNICDNGVTPAMEAKLTTKPMTIDDIVNLIPQEEPKKREAYKKKNQTEGAA